MKDLIALLFKAPQFLKLLVSWAPAILRISKELQALSGRKDFDSIKGVILSIIGIVVTAGGWIERDVLNTALANLGDVITALGALWTAAGTMWATYGFRKAIAETNNAAVDAGQQAEVAKVAATAANSAVNRIEANRR